MKNLEDRILDAMEKAQKKFKAIIPDECYIDDCGWGERSFRIRIFTNDVKTSYESKLDDEFVFIYDEDDVFERSLEKQCEDALAEHIDMYWN